LNPGGASREPWCGPQRGGRGTWRGRRTRGRCSTGTPAWRPPPAAAPRTTSPSRRSWPTGLAGGCGHSPPPSPSLGGCWVRSQLRSQFATFFWSLTIPPSTSAFTSAQRGVGAGTARPYPPQWLFLGHRRLPPPLLLCLRKALARTTPSGGDRPPSPHGRLPFAEPPWHWLVYTVPPALRPPIAPDQALLSGRPSAQTLRCPSRRAAPKRLGPRMPPSRAPPGG